MDFNRISLNHVYKLLEDGKFIEAIETYLSKDQSEPSTSNLVKV